MIQTTYAWLLSQLLYLHTHDTVHTIPFLNCKGGKRSVLLLHCTKIGGGDKQYCS